MYNTAMGSVERKQYDGKNQPCWGKVPGLACVEDCQVFVQKARDTVHNYVEDQTSGRGLAVYGSRYNEARPNEARLTQTEHLDGERGIYRNFCTQDYIDGVLSEDEYRRVEDL